MFFGSKKKKTQKEDTPAPLANVDDAVSLLNQFSHPQLVEQWASQPHWVSADKNGFKVTFPFAAASVMRALEEWLNAQSAPLKQQFHLVQRVAPLKSGDKSLIKGVKNLLVVSSAKGGVGKSTTAVNLALALQAEGASVGVVDADVYGPSLPIMLGAKDSEPQTHDGKLMEPVMRHGIASNSIGYLVPADNATVWRGPMASKAFAQLINETRWPELDYLVVDMPPGTGDIQLSLAQQFPVTGAIVVTTPQDLALADAIKGVAMFEKVEVPVLGVVENMSYHICSQCGHHEAIFGTGGAEKMAREQGVPVLAQVPLHVAIREDIDAGTPSMVARPGSDHAAVYQQMAATVASQLYWQGETRPEQISVQTVSP
ncbi:iron-sulfur cluster carrier protein ApbC [Salinivibrio sp. ES.052]|uniref:iron-sulfur cluster carrier protein ApbC n=1 Tax=Salinivibrio sp. ES.052 TaxID=1882823 RepID=UPI000926F640|nr:iron-sulfur cluster carrier protein ApbC [Salinivibrio sp. ES.052]SIN93086.1 ATP-binding protein involved in chromosome partitioning [Salinivibrio sp. ES.052]